VGIAVGGPPYDVVPYGGHKAKHGAKLNTWDESDEEESGSSEEEIVPKVSATVVNKALLTPQSPPSGHKVTSLNQDMTNLAVDD
jgi:hypothetical protein